MLTGRPSVRGAFDRGITLLPFSVKIEWRMRIGACHFVRGALCHLMTKPNGTSQTDVSFPRELGFNNYISAIVHTLKRKQVGLSSGGQFFIHSGCSAIDFRCISCSNSPNTTFCRGERSVTKRRVWGHLDQSCCRGASFRLLILLQLTSTAG